MCKRKVRWSCFLGICLMMSMMVYGFTYVVMEKIPEVFAAEHKRAKTLQELPQEYQEELKAIKEQYPNDERIDHMIQNYTAYPLILFTLLKGNSDTFSYVYEYPLHTEQTKRYTLEKKELSQGMPYLYQWDKRWGYLTYGENMLGLTGCAPTALSMILSYLKQDVSITPDAIARYSEQMGYYLDGQGTMWQLFHEYAAQMGVRCKELTQSADHVRTSLLQDRPVLMSMGAGDFTTSGHLIVLSGMDVEGKLIVHDPNSATRSAMHWDMETLLSQCVAVWEFY